MMDSGHIKFSYEGPIEYLLGMLGAMQTEHFLAADEADSTSSAPLVPQHVSSQRPPPPAPLLTPPTIEPLNTDPVYGRLAASGPSSSLVPSNPTPTQYPLGSGLEEPLQLDWSKVPLQAEAWGVFADFVGSWLVGFEAPTDEEGNPTVEQPDRLTLLKNIGSGRWPIPILRWLAQYGSLQGAIYELLQRKPAPSEDLIEFTNRLSANIAQLAHAGFPDIIAFHDHGTKWRRRITA